MKKTLRTLTVLLLALCLLASLAACSKSGGSSGSTGGGSSSGSSQSSGGSSSGGSSSGGSNPLSRDEDETPSSGGSGESSSSGGSESSGGQSQSPLGGGGTTGIGGGTTGIEDRTPLTLDTVLQAIETGNTELFDPAHMTQQQKDDLRQDVEREGGTVTYAADGSFTVRSKDGGWLTVHPDGSFEGVDDDGQSLTSDDIGHEWPDSDLFRTIPQPGFPIQASMEDEGAVYVMFASATEEEAQAYIQQLKDAGFTLNAQDYNYPQMGMLGYSGVNEDNIYVEFMRMTDEDGLTVMLSAEEYDGEIWDDPNGEDPWGEDPWGEDPWGEDPWSEYRVAGFPAPFDFMNAWLDDSYTIYDFGSACSATSSAPASAGLLEQLRSAGESAGFTLRDSYEDDDYKEYDLVDAQGNEVYLMLKVGENSLSIQAWPSSGQEPWEDPYGNTGLPEPFGFLNGLVLGRYAVENFGDFALVSFQANSVTDLASERDSLVQALQDEGFEAMGVMPLNDDTWEYKYYNPYNNAYIELVYSEYNTFLSLSLYPYPPAYGGGEEEEEEPGDVGRQIRARYSFLDEYVADFYVDVWEEDNDMELYTYTGNQELYEKLISVIEDAGYVRTETWDEYDDEGDYYQGGNFVNGELQIGMIFYSEYEYLYLWCH